MKINIVSVTPGKYEAIETNEPMPMYRRYAPEHWCHCLGNLHGWNRLIDVSLHEEVYQEWVRNEKAKTNDK